MNVQVDELRGIVVEGYADIRAGREQVVLNGATHATRRAFTLAHELGHIWLFRWKTCGRDVNLRRFRDGLPGKGSKADPTEEWLCNTFASELLMPSRYLGLVVAPDKAFSPHTLLEVTEQFGVSIQAAAKKCAELRECRHLMVARWQKDSRPVLKWWCGSGKTVTVRVELEQLVEQLMSHCHTQKLVTTLGDGRTAIASRIKGGGALVAVEANLHDRASNSAEQLTLFERVGV